MVVRINEQQYNNLKYYSDGTNQDVFEVDGENYVVKKSKSNHFNNKELQDYNTMKQYPHICAKIFKITPQEVWQEKIDDKKFRIDLQYLMRQLIKNGYHKFGDDLDINLDNLLYSIFDENFELKQAVVNCDKPAFVLYKKLFDWGNIFGSIPNSYNWDVHHKQFGYDKEGKIKIFDI